MIRDDGNGWLAPADENDPYRRRILGRSGLTWLLIKGGKHADMVGVIDDDDEEENDDDDDHGDDANDSVDGHASGDDRDWSPPQLRAVPPSEPRDDETDQPDATDRIQAPVAFDAPLHLPADHPMPMQVRRMLGMFVGSLAFDDDLETGDDDTGDDDIVRMIRETGVVNRWLDIDIVGVVFDVSPRTIRRWVGAGRFPRPGRGGGRGRMCYWRESVIHDAWTQRAALVANRLPRRSKKEDR